MRALAVVLAVLLAACAPAPEAPRRSLTPEPAPSSAASPDLLAQRRAAGLPDCPASSDLPAVAGGFPDVALSCLGGGSTVRLAGLRGPMIINYWAQWCGPCRAEAPHLAEFSQMAGGKVTVLGIDAADPRPELAIEFASMAGWRYVHLQDPERRSMAPVGQSLPVTVFVDANGVIVYKNIGAFGSTQQIRDRVAQHLGVTV